MLLTSSVPTTKFQKENLRKLVVAAEFCVLLLTLTFCKNIAWLYIFLISLASGCGLAVYAIFGTTGVSRLLKMLLSRIYSMIYFFDRWWLWLPMKQTRKKINVQVIFLDRKKVTYSISRVWLKLEQHLLVPYHLSDLQNFKAKF